MIAGKGHQSVGSLITIHQATLKISLSSDTNEVWNQFCAPWVSVFSQWIPPLFGLWLLMQPSYKVSSSQQKVWIMRMNSLRLKLCSCCGSIYCKVWFDNILFNVSSKHPHVSLFPLWLCIYEFGNRFKSRPIVQVISVWLGCTLNLVI